MIDLFVIYQVIGNVQKVIWHVRLVYSSSPGIVSPSPIVSPVATESSAVLSVLLNFKTAAYLLCDNIRKFLV